MSSAGDLGVGSGLLAAARRHLVLVAASILVASAVAGVFAGMQAPVYEATAEVLLDSRSVDPVTGTPISVDPARVMQTEVQVAMSLQVRDLVREELGTAPPITAVPAGQSDVLRITAVADESARAARIANAYAASYIEFRKEQTSNELTRTLDAVNNQLRALERQAASADRVKRELLTAEQSVLRQRRDAMVSALALVTGGATVLNTAVPPPDPVSPNLFRSLALGGMAGLVVGVLLALAIDRPAPAPPARRSASFGVRAARVAESLPEAADGAYVEHPNRVARWLDNALVPDRSTDDGDVTVWFRLDPHHAEPPAWEGLLARMVQRDRAVILAVPVFAADVNFGDEVRVVPAATGPLVAAEVTVPGDSCTFRVQFSEWTEPADDPRRLALISQLGALGCLFDVFTPRLMAVSARLAQGPQAAEILEEAQHRGELVYGTPRTNQRQQAGLESTDGPVSFGSNFN